MASAHPVMIAREPGSDLAVHERRHVGAWDVQFTALAGCPFPGSVSLSIERHEIRHTTHHVCDGFLDLHL